MMLSRAIHHHSRRFSKTRFRWNHNLDTSSQNETFLHIGPSGDCWTGASLFAAKHLTPGYVKSIPLSSLLFDEDTITRLLDLLQEEPEWCHQMYDTQTVPTEVLSRVVTKSERVEK